MLGSPSIHAECQTSPKQNGHFNISGNGASLQRFVSVEVFLQSSFSHHFQAYKIYYQISSSN